jgi:hypothetical protein
VRAIRLIAWLFFGTIILGALTWAALHFTLTSARTTDATMSMTVSAGGTCAGTTCTVPLNTQFTLRVSAAVPPAEGYVGFQTEVNYTALLSSGGVYLPRAIGTEVTLFALLLARSALRALSTTPTCRAWDCRYP